MRVVWQSALLPMLLCGCELPEPGTEKIEADPVEAQAALRPPPNDFIRLDELAAEAPAGATKTFLEALSFSYRNSVSVRGPVLRADGLDAQAESARGILRPELSASADTFNTGVRVTARQPLYDFGKQEARVATILASRDSEIYNQAVRRERLLTSALGAALDIRFARERAALFRRQIDDLETARATAERLAALNILSAADVRLAEVEVERARISHARARNDADAAQRLWQELDAPQALPATLDPLRLRRAAGIATLSEAEKTAKARNLAFREFDAEESAVVAEISSIERANTPTVNAEVVGSTETDVRAGLSLTYPIFNQDRGADLAEARARLDALAAERASTSREIEQDLSSAAQRIAQAAQIAGSLDRSLALLNQRVADLETQLDRGLASYSDVIEAKTVLYTSELEILESRDAIRRGHAETILLTGALIP